MHIVVFGCSVFFMSVCIGGENISTQSNQIDQCISRHNFIFKLGFNFSMILARWFLVVPPKEKFVDLKKFQINFIMSKLGPKVFCKRKNHTTLVHSSYFLFHPCNYTLFVQSIIWLSNLVENGIPWAQMFGKYHHVYIEI